jgi:16S rRNA (cytosine1402-N4)-methyltransferase
MHIPVLLQEVIDGLALSPNDNCIDGTVGFGGHAHTMLERTNPNGRLVGFDRDASTLLLATENLKEFGNRFMPIHDSYATLKDHEEALAFVQPVSGILVDLGLSSIQLDIAERGFSFRVSGPLDMRFDQTTGPTAADILNTAEYDKLRRILREFGEVQQPGRLARAIIRYRENDRFRETDQLVTLVEEVYGGQRGARIHPATRVFQAFRIEVNNELDHLRTFLPDAVDLLASGGRLAVISFHSLEDRIVKHAFREMAKDCVCPPDFPECRCEHPAQIELITKKAIVPTEKEILRNPRARSAKLRVIKKI